MNMWKRIYNKLSECLIMKISVIIPMYNEEDNVLRTLVEVNSVMKEYEDYEDPLLWMMGVKTIHLD